MMSTVASRQAQKMEKPLQTKKEISQRLDSLWRADKYRLNYVEVEIGPPKRREGDKVPAIKVSNGSSNRVNYSTIVFPNKNANTSDTPPTSSEDNVIRIVPQIPPHHGSLAPTFTFAPSGKESGHSSSRVGNSNPGNVFSGGRKRPGNHGPHIKLERKGSQLTEAQLQHQQQQHLEIAKTPPSSPPRRRALSTPTCSRKFPSDSEMDETINPQDERESAPPKTRTLPSREIPWNSEAAEKDFRDDDVEATSPRRPDLQKTQMASLDSGMMSNTATSNELSHAMQAMRMKKVRRKSSTGDSFEILNDPLEIAKMAALSQQEQASSSSPTAIEPPPLSPEAANILRSSPVMKRHRTELEKAFARRKLTGRISGEPDGYISQSGSHSSSGECSPPEGITNQLSDMSSMGAKFIPVLPAIKSSRDRGTPDGQKTSSGEFRFIEHSHQQARKPIPAPRFGQQSRDSSSESINDSLYLNQRPIPSPPSQQQSASSAMQDVTATQITDETYMNVAFAKPKQDSHRYENVFLDDRALNLDRCSNASDSPRDSLEIHSNRPIPAPRMHGCSNNNVQPTSPLDPSNNHHQGNQNKPTSQHQQGKQHGHTRQGSYGSTAAILSHINASPSPVSPGGPCSPNKPKHKVATDSVSDVLYATPSKHGHSAQGSGSSHGNHHNHAPMKATHGIVPEVPLSAKPEIPSHASSSARRDSHGSTSSLGNSHSNKGTDGEKSLSLGKALSHLIKDSEKRERRHRMHGDKKSREERRAYGEKKDRHGDREKRSHGKRHRGDGSHGSSSSKSKGERPSYGNQPWYYGRMLRQECEYLMLSQGQSCQYLVRDSSHRTGDLMLSVLFGSKVHHYVIQTTPNHKFHIAHHDFNKVEDILEFYHHHVIMYSPDKEPVYLTEPFILKHK